jgi:hypothetical protein
MSRRICCYRCRRVILDTHEITTVSTQQGDCTTWTPTRLCAECSTDFDRWLRTRPTLGGLYSDPPLVTVSR